MKHWRKEISDLARIQPRPRAIFRFSTFGWASQETRSPRLPFNLVRFFIRIIISRLPCES